MAKAPQANGFKTVLRRPQVRYSLDFGHSRLRIGKSGNYRRIVARDDQSRRTGELLHMVLRFGLLLCARQHAEKSRSIFHMDLHRIG